MANSKVSAVEKLLERMGMSSSSFPGTIAPSHAAVTVEHLKEMQQFMNHALIQGSGMGNFGGLAGLGVALQQAQVSPASIQSTEQKRVDQQKAVSTLTDRISQLHSAVPIKLTSRIPDLVGTITAWRGWKLVDGKLCALGMTGVWEPKKIVKAICGKTVSLTLPHDAPVKDCKCGYWSFRTMELLQQALDPYATSVQVIGSVEVWGKVVECESGFRSEFAYPKELWLLEEGLDHLSWVYGVPVRRIGQ